MLRIGLLFLATVWLCGSAPAAAADACRYTGGSAVMRTPGRPFDVQPTADGCWLFVSLGKAGGDTKAGVATYALKDGKYRLAQVTPLDGGPAGMALSHDGAVLAVTANSAVYLLDVDRLKAGHASPVLRKVDVGDGAGAIAAVMTRDDTTLFVTLERRAQVIALDLAALRQTASAASPLLGAIPTGRAPVGMALSPDGARLYATSQVARPASGYRKRCVTETGQVSEGMLSTIDVSGARADIRKAVIAEQAAGCSPVRVAVSAAGEAFVTARGENAVLRFPVDAKATRAAAIKVGDAPVGVAVRPDGAEVWVANSARFKGGDGSLTRIDARSGETTSTPSGEFPRELDFLPDGKTLVATQFNGLALQFVATGD
jgi:DNA-binding beta-propeller fold protein YncE